MSGLGVLITGGAGYLGSVLCERLLAAGCRVTVVDNLMYRQRSLFQFCANPNFKFEFGDVRHEALTTDLSAAAAAVASQCSGRWAIEDTFRQTKQALGGEDPQTWKDDGPERPAALSFWIYAAVWLWYLKVYGNETVVAHLAMVSEEVHAALCRCAGRASPHPLAPADFRELQFGAALTKTQRRPHRDPRAGRVNLSMQLQENARKLRKSTTTKSRNLRS